jgi:pimeloyl-ACP methyl ester carboxylesterase
LGSRFNWRSQWEFLHANQHTAIAYDLAGHGNSSRYRRYSVGRHRRDLTRLLKHFKVHKPILCCHSYGVPIGLEWASRHHASALILIGGGTHNLTPWWEVPLTRLLAAGGHHLHRAPTVQRWLRTLTSQHNHDVVDRFFQENPLPQDSHPYEAMQSFWGYDGRLKPISCPVLVITGEDDPVFPPSMGADLADHFDWEDLHCQHLSVPGAGHLVMAEVPDVVNQAILEMVGRVRREVDSRDAKTQSGSDRPRS